MPPCRGAGALRRRRPLCRTRLRGLVRIGERRWDVVLDRDQRILLPADRRRGALERVIALDEAHELLARDIAVVDMRNPDAADRADEPEAVDEWAAADQTSTLGGRPDDDRPLPEPARDAEHAPAAMQRGVIAILDVGTSKIACLSCASTGPSGFREADGHRRAGRAVSFRVIGAATTRSRGVRFGEIDAMQETERAIRTAVQAAQKMANVRVDHVIACFLGARPRQLRAGRAGRPDEGTVTEATWRACWRPATCPITARGARCCTPSR
jgi:hypothetical protein